MAELSLNPADLRAITPLLRGCERPPGVRPGTWLHLTTEPCPIQIDMAEVRALATLRPRVLRVLGIVGSPDPSAAPRHGVARGA